MGAKGLARGAAAMVAGVILLVAPPASFAARTVVGGTPAQPQSAPWTVLVRQASPPSSYLCGGSILDELHIVTAAHCVLDRSGAQAPTAAFLIRAGVTNYRAPVGPDEQDRFVSSIRIHPGYGGSGSVSPDDVAVIALSAPLDLGKPALQAVALPGRDASFPAGTQVAFAGFGREATASAADGSLNWVTATVDEQAACGGFSNSVLPAASAIAFCASSHGVALCSGDSGSGVVTTTDPVTLIGVINAGSPTCDMGSSGVFAYLGAPEILAFVRGDDRPPVAPRALPATFARLSWVGEVHPGSTLTCASGDWDGAATLSYAFVSGTTGQALQRGASPAFVVSASQVQDAVYCRAFATNEGGTASLRTGLTPEVAPPPAVRIGQVGTLLAARGGTVTFRVLVRTSRPGLSGKLGVCVTPSALVATRVCRSGWIESGTFGLFPVTVRLRIKPTAPLGATHVAVTAVAGPSKSATVATVSVGRA